MVEPFAKTVTNLRKKLWQRRNYAAACVISRIRIQLPILVNFTSMWTEILHDVNFRNAWKIIIASVSALAFNVYRPEMASNTLKIL